MGIRQGGRKNVHHRKRDMLPELQIRRPNEMHVHFRDGDMLKTVVPYTARQFSRAVVMPNITPPIVTSEDAVQYRNRILQAVPENIPFEPLMMAYLTADTDPDDIAQGYADGVFFGAKLYPAHATTNSHFGVSHITQITDVLKTMQDIGMPLSVHGEVPYKEVDIFDREAVFLDEVLAPLLSAYPNLRVTMEHITTAQAVEFLKSAGDNVAATVTPQHLLYDRNDMLVGGIKPHYYCLPILKRSHHKWALRELVTSGFKRVFLGTDSAPHSIDTKECACGCAGVFSAINALEFYAQVFDEENALDKLEDFTTNNADNFHNFMPSNGGITLIKSGNLVPRELTVAGSNQKLHPLCSDTIIPWRADYRIDKRYDDTTATCGGMGTPSGGIQNNG